MISKKHLKWACKIIGKIKKIMIMIEKIND